METKKHFFSKNNILGLTKQICNQLGVTNDNKEDIKGISNIANISWEKGQKLIGRYPSEKIVRYLNKKTVENILDKINYSRLKYKNNQHINEKHPTYKSNRNETGYSGLDQRPFGDFAKYNPYDAGECILADGSVGDNMEKRKMHEGFDKTKKETLGNIEERYAGLVQDRRYANTFGQGNMNMGNVQRPDINFAVDGGDSRQHKNVNNNNQNNEQFPGLNDMQGNQYEGFSNIDSMQQLLPDNGNQYQFANMPMNTMPMNNMPMNNMPMNNMPFSTKSNETSTLNLQMEQMMGMFTQLMNVLSNNTTVNNTEINAYSEMNNNLKKTIASSIDIDPERIINLTSEEIGKLIADKKKNTTPVYLRNDDDDDEPLEPNKAKDFLKKIIQVKKENIKKKQTLDDFVNDIVNKKSEKESAETRSNQSDLETKKKKKSNQKKFIVHKKSIDSDNSSSEIEKKKGTTQKKFSVKKQYVTKNEHDDDEDQPAKKTSIRQIIIDSQTVIDNPHCENHYNDYIVNFDAYYDNLTNGKYLSGVRKIILDSIDIKITPEITKTYTFTIKENNSEEFHISIEPGIYTIDEIIDGFNAQFEAEMTDISIKKNKDDIITLAHTKDKVFDIDCSTKESFGKFLGFSEKTYTGKTKYIADTKHAFNENPIYLYIKNIKNNLPFAKINTDGTYEQYYNTTDDKGTIVNIDLLIIQFRSNEKNSEKVDDDKTKLINLGDTPHTITLNFEQVI